MNQRLDIIGIGLGPSNLREGANKQVISSQADSLIKISRIWADFFPQTHRISLFRLFFPPFLALFPVLLRSLPLTYHLVHPKQVGGVNNIASWLSFSAAPVSGFHEAELPLDDAKRVLHRTDAGFHVFDVDGRFVLARMLLQGFTLPGRSAISQSTSTSASSSRCGAPW